MMTKRIRIPLDKQVKGMVFFKDSSCLYCHFLKKIQIISLYLDLHCGMQKRNLFRQIVKVDLGVCEFLT